jgi:hypothetical protein
MIICRVCARRFFQFPIMFTNNKKWRSASWFTMFNSVFSFPTFLLFSPFRLVRSNTWVQWKHLTLERSIDLCLQTFPKLLLLLVPQRAVYTQNALLVVLWGFCIANNPVVILRSRWSLRRLSADRGRWIIRVKVVQALIQPE